MPQAASVRCNAVSRVLSQRRLLCFDAASSISSLQLTMTVIAPNSKSISSFDAASSISSLQLTMKLKGEINS